MTGDGTYVATVDRIEEGLAVCLLEDDDEVVCERHVEEEELPDDCGEGAVLELTLRDGRIEELEFDPERTRRRRERTQSRFDRLSRRPDEDGD
ncbi:DUF3006 domain-containing protein [Halalkalicoccus ordinarius]|uniref:DUF3006 domain-containing protein n=1 Tax=Halalkalicoccus ordinarius TaxID=3116651 RepID=UPI00300EA754